MLLRILIKTWSFLWMHVSHQQCHRKPEIEHLRGWTSRGSRVDDMNSWGAMKWWAMSEGRVIVLHFLKIEDSSGVSCRNMLIYFAFPRFKMLQQAFFWKDGSPLQFPSLVTTIVNNKHTTIWIGKGGLPWWQAGSPRLSTCNLFPAILSNRRYILRP